MFNSAMILAPERKFKMLQLDQELSPKKEKLVGPILSNNFTVSAIIKALQELNPDIQITSKGSYIMALAPERCVLSRYVVEKYLGRQFNLPHDLDVNMSSFSGKYYLLRDEAFWLT